MTDAARDKAEAQRAGELADELRRIQAEEAALHARRIHVLAEAFAITEAQTSRIASSASKEREMPLRSMAAELGMAVRMNDRTMQSRMWDAFTLCTSFRVTTTALEEGRITQAHASAILDTGRVIDEPSARAAFEQTVLGYAETTTPARTRAYARSQADVFNPLTMQERHDLAVQGRRIWVTDLDDGMSLLHQLLPTVIAHGILDRTTRQARLIMSVDRARRRAFADEDRGGVASGGVASGGVAPGGVASGGVIGVDNGGWAGGPRCAGDASLSKDASPAASTEPDEPVWFDDRTLDQTRADLVADMLLTGAPCIDPAADAAPGGLGSIRAHVQVTIPVTTLTGVTSGGAELDGIAPVDPETARQLAGNAPGWDRILTDPVTGIVLAVDRHDPPPAMRRFLDARDRHCRAPGCRRPARQCDHDHTIDYALGGRTEYGNLANVCKRHHTLKHASRWTVRQLAGGTLEFTSPSGRAYSDTPTPRVVFLPSDEPPAPF
ncbi:HNH endonuclease signature motif containing protein [Microbacterium atlanticum]|uniref:HNH endonuclease signature motif containing protein n=1 Tax=Microbacterium atlanticum TaxID=2782168 RepID=UPI0018871C16|nr:HNH endonuclease signature motif containing protein [Microbacterium atlanticum]